MNVDEKVDHVMGMTGDEHAVGDCVLHGDTIALKFIHPTGPNHMDSVCAECLQEALHEWFTEIESIEAAELPYGADKWEDVRSSNIANFGRKGDDLMVRFKSGATYQYPDAGNHFDALMESTSKGRMFASLKGQLRKFTKL